MTRYSLMTEYGERLSGGVPLPEYPRPQLRRDSYINLNGIWSYRIGREEGTILVPFPMESALSGVPFQKGAPRSLKKGKCLVYSRTVNIPEDFLKDITLLHIDAADAVLEAYLNGTPIGSHEGGYLPAVFDISGAVRAGENLFELRVRDELCHDLPTGKQKRRRGGIWYTPVSGIWQSVWLESAGRGYVKSLRMTPNIGDSTLLLEIDSEAPSFEILASYGGKTVFQTKTSEKTLLLTVPREELHLWSPKSPCLYDLTVKTEDDSVCSYFAMRCFEAKNGRFYLNNEPYFVNGLLDQGYFSDGIYTPASYDAYRDDVLQMKRLGFNTLRKHIKIESMQFYYACDTLGMLVLQDMVNVGKYSFFKDTVLPFAGLRGRRPYVNVSKKGRENFTRHALMTVNYLYSVPSVVYYTVFNEGWGQFDGDGLYRLLKKADGTRVYDATSGWFYERESDVLSEHIYFRPIRPAKTGNRPWIVSEFGGYSYSVEGHRFGDREFGYRKYKTAEALENDFLALYENEILGNLKNGLAGAIYTQVSDVEDETNGILTYDRRLCKLSPERVLPLMQRIEEAFSALARE